MEKRLSFQSRVKLYGRTSELETLRDALTRAKQPNQRTQAVFVAGSSGSGKTTLIEKAFNDKGHCDDCCYGSGKFEEHHSTPYAALVNALSSLCTDIAREDHQREEYVKELQDGLTDEEVQLLQELLRAPFLSQILFRKHETGTGERADRAEATLSKEGPEALKYTLRRFLKAICSSECPVILFLDDLQWIDQATLDILKSVVTDFELHNLVIVGSYRDTEVDKEHPLMKWIESMAEDASPLLIQIRDLEANHVESILLDIFLRPADDETKDLAALIYSLTNGNIFHVLQLINLLQLEGMIFINKSAQQWEWDLAKIQDQTILTDNAIDVVMAQINRLPPEVQVFLKVLSCLGSQFEESVLLSLTEMDAVGEDSLRSIIVEGLLERLDDHRFQFAHDKIRQAASQLISTSAERAKLHYDIGMLLWRNNRFDDAGDAYVFLCADQLNCGRQYVDTTNLNFSFQVMGLNCRAAKAAAAVSAFQPAVNYVQAAISLQDPSICWENNYDLTLELYTLLAELSVCIGLLDLHEGAVMQVLGHAMIVDDRIRVYLARIQGYCAQAKFKELVKTSLYVLLELGEDIPLKPSAFYKKRALDRVKKKFRAIPGGTDSLLKRRKTTDRRKTAAIHILSEMVTSAVQLGWHNLTCVLISRMLLLTLDVGLAPHSALACAINAQLFVSERMDVDIAFQMAKLALNLVHHRPDAAKTRSGAMLYSYNNFHWREPLSMITDRYIETFQVGMREGDLHNAFQSIIAYCFTYFYSGLPLDPLLNDVMNFNRLMFEYGHKFFLLINVPIHQCILNLTGQSEDILNLDEGTATEYREKVGWESRAGEQVQWSYMMQLAVYSEDLEQATAMYEKLEHMPVGVVRSVAFYHTRVFFFALIAIWNAKAKGGRRWKRRAHEHFSMVKSWVTKYHAINVVHKLQILEAEVAAMDGNMKDEKLEKLYDKAIVASTRAGYHQDAGLAANLASHSMADVHKGREYFLRAREAYLCWGARGLVDYLDHLPSCTASLPLTRVRRLSHKMSGYRGRERFDSSLIQEHKSLVRKESDEKESTKRSITRTRRDSLVVEKQSIRLSR
jgi:predicted ATPase